MTGPAPKPPIVRWAKYVDRPNDDDCWIWNGAVDHTGYGRFKAAGKITLVHRWTYEHFVGPIPAGLTIDHLCRNTVCVNYRHFEVVTRAENARRGNPNTGKTHCHQGHEFTEANTYVKPNGRRDCRACRKVKRAESAARSRTAAYLATHTSTEWAS